MNDIFAQITNILSMQRYVNIRNTLYLIQLINKCVIDNKSVSRRRYKLEKKINENIQKLRFSENSETHAIDDGHFHTETIL